LLAYIAVSKYGDGLPLYRPEAIFLRDHVDVDRAIMARWMGKLGFELEILADYTFEPASDIDALMPWNFKE
jgi:transposase